SGNSSVVNSRRLTVTNPICPIAGHTGASLGEFFRHATAVKAKSQWSRKRCLALPRHAAIVLGGCGGVVALLLSNVAACASGDKGRKDENPERTFVHMDYSGLRDRVAYPGVGFSRCGPTRRFRRPHLFAIWRS